MCKISVVQMFILKDTVYTCTGMKLNAMLQQSCKTCSVEVWFCFQWFLNCFLFFWTKAALMLLWRVYITKLIIWYIGLQSSIFPKRLNTISWNDKEILLLNQMIWIPSAALNLDSLNSYFEWVLNKLYNTYVRSIGSCFDFCIGGGYF